MIYKIPQHAKGAMTDDYTFVPAHTRESIVNYLEHGYEPGSFMYAVIENDLKSAFSSADNINSQCLKSIVCWFYNFCPASAWGRYGVVNEWIENSRSAA